MAKAVANSNGYSGLPPKSHTEDFLSQTSSSEEAFPGIVISNGRAV
jgi:hypothetical protein